MLALDDPRWEQLEGGYREPYDPREALQALRAGDAGAYDELWEELHHQGDVGLASYAAVPWLVRIACEAPVRDWQPYALVATIEVARSQKQNPPVPEWLRADLEDALQRLARQGLADLPGADSLTARAILGVLALSKGLRVLGRLISELDESELGELEHEAFGTAGDD